MRQQLWPHTDRREKAVAYESRGNEIQEERCKLGRSSMSQYSPHRRNDCRKLGCIIAERVDANTL